MPRNIYGAVRCRAHRQDGQPCQQWAIHHATVCVTHGGLIPAVKAEAQNREREARDRLYALVHPAIARLASLIDSADTDATRLAAAKAVLDYCGFKTTEKLEQSGTMTIEIEYVNRPIPARGSLAASSNGTQPPHNGHLTTSRN